MKKIISLFACFLIIVSCTNDDDNTPPIEEPGSIYGKWYFQETVINDTIILYDDHEYCGKDYIEFYDEDKVRGIDIWDCEEDLMWEGTFSLEGNELTISNGSQSRTVEVLQLTAHVLSYTYTFDEDGDGNEDTIIESFTRI